MGILIENRNITRPLVPEMSIAEYNALFEERVPILTDTHFTVRSIMGYRFTTVFGADTEGGSNELLINDAPFNAEILAGSGAYDEDTGSFTNSAASSTVRSANRVYLSGSRIKINRKGTEEHSFLLRDQNGNGAFIFELITGELKDGAGNVADTASWSGGFTGGTDIDVELVLEGDDIVVYEDSVERLRYTARWLVDHATATVTPATEQDLFTDIDLDFTGIASGETDIDIEWHDSLGAVIANLGNTYKAVVGTILGKLIISRDLGSLTFEDTLAEDASGDFTGGVGNIVYSLTSGSLPQGLSLNGSTGALTGQPTQEGVFNFSVKAKDEYGQQQTVSYSLVVTAAINIEYNPPNGIVGKSYNYTPPLPSKQATSWSIAGALPTGISFNTTNGKLSGVPTETGAAFNFTVIAVFVDGSSEQAHASFAVYDALSVEFQDSEAALTSLVSGGQFVSYVGNVGRVIPSGGSGTYFYYINNGNQVDKNGNISFDRAGDATLTVYDAETGESFSVTVQVYGQDSVASVGVDDVDTDDIVIDNPDLITQCDTPLNVAFDGWSIFTNWPKDSKSSPDFDVVVNGVADNSGRPFARFHSTARDSFVSVKHTKGKDFVTTFVLTASMMFAHPNEDIMGMGIGRTDDLDTPLRYEVRITNYFSGRVLELWHDGVYVPNSRVENIEEGMTVSFGVIDNVVYLWVNDNLESSLSASEGCTDYPLVWYSKPSNVFIGGRIQNLIYSIETPGTSAEVGTVDVQTGVYTPSPTNTPRVTILGTSPSNSTINYRAKIRIIRPATKESLERATIQYVPVDMWIADIDRGDNLPLELSRKGEPDANQIKNAQYLGILQGAVGFSATEDRQEATDDQGVIATSHRITKFSITGTFLQVRRLDVLQRLIPYTKVTVENGVRVLRQYSTGCQKRMRVILIWRNPDCDDVEVYDAMEFHNCQSYTLANMSLGLSEQSAIPLVIDSFKRDTDGAFWDMNQYGQRYTRLGS